LSSTPTTARRHWTHHRQRPSSTLYQRSTKTIINPASKIAKDHNQQPLHETTINNPVSKIIKDHNQQPLHETTINNPVSKTIDKDHQQPLYETTINPSYKFY
jgi:hypothetical protein